MPKKKVWWVILWTVLAAVFIIGGPFAINETYKVGNEYVTMWGAAYVLGYYGAILGTVATIIALAFTIWFTRKQIQRDSYLKNETEKWRLIDSTIGNILFEIDPMAVLKQEIDSGFADYDKAVNLFQKYQMSCRLATDQLMTRVNTVDYKKIERLVNQIQKVAEKFFQLSQNKVDQYGRMRQLREREATLKLLAIEQQYPGSLSASEVAKHQETIRMTEGICLEDIINVLGEISKEFMKEYDKEFRPLLQLKGATFEVIHQQIQAKADAILSF